MSVDRFDFTATLLRDGRVLVGGLSGNGTGVQAGAELYDPDTGRWTSTGSLRTPRRNHTAMLLLDGSVLVAGGFNSEGWLQSAELYDPARGRWKRVAPMTVAREHASATLLGNGRVLVAGGGNPSATLSAELYDPAAGRWTPTARMTDYHGPQAVLLQDGRVLLAGGGYAGDVYSPATGTWTATGPRFHGLVGGAALAPLPNGQVLSVGGSRLANCSSKGCGSEPVASAELYTPVARNRRRVTDELQEAATRALDAAARVRVRVRHTCQSRQHSKLICRDFRWAVLESNQRPWD